MVQYGGPNMSLPISDIFYFSNESLFSKVFRVYKFVWKIGLTISISTQF